MLSGGSVQCIKLVEMTASRQLMACVSIHLSFKQTIPPIRHNFSFNTLIKHHPYSCFEEVIKRHKQFFFINLGILTSLSVTGIWDRLGHSKNIYIIWMDRVAYLKIFRAPSLGKYHVIFVYFRARWLLSKNLPLWALAKDDITTAFCTAARLWRILPWEVLSNPETLQQSHTTVCC